MCHRQGFFIFALLNLLFPHLHAFSPHFYMLQMSAGLHSSLNRCTNSNLCLEFKALLSTPCISKVIKVLMKSEERTTRPERGSYVTVTSTEGIWGSELDVDRITSFSTVAGQYTVASLTFSMATRRSLLLKISKSRRWKHGELITIFLPHAWLPEIGNRKGDRGSNLVVPGVRRAVQSGKHTSWNRTETGMSVPHATRTSPCTERALDWSTRITFFFSNCMKFFLSVFIFYFYWI